MAGLRVKLPYDTYADCGALRRRSRTGFTIGEIAEVEPSRMRDYIIVRVKPFSETNIVV